MTNFLCHRSVGFIKFLVKRLFPKRIDKQELAGYCCEAAGFSNAAMAAVTKQSVIEISARPTTR